MPSSGSRGRRGGRRTNSGRLTNLERLVRSGRPAGTRSVPSFFSQNAPDDDDGQHAEEVAPARQAGVDGANSNSGNENHVPAIPAVRNAPFGRHSKNTRP